MKAGFYGLASSLSVRAGFYELEKRQTLIGMQQKMELIRDTDDRLELDIYVAEKNHETAELTELEQEQAWLQSVGTRFGAEYSAQGGDMGISDAGNLSILAAASGLYFGQKFFEVFSESSFE